MRERKLTAVVTGASSGIGRAIALELASLCSVLVLMGRDSRRLASVRRAIERLGARTVVHQCDFQDRRDVERVGRRLRIELRRLDVLVHAAGCIRLGKFEQARWDDFEKMMSVNLIAPWLLTSRLLRRLRESKGQIVFINSSLVFHPSPETAMYAASKHALRGLADGLRCEVNRAGVRVLSIYPGRIATPLQASVHAREKRVYRPSKLAQPEDIARIATVALGLSRTAEVTEIYVRQMRKD
jgi:short-subunit dehydrogenase